MNDDIFIFCIAYNCGKVLNKMLESFHKYHNMKINIFGTYKDFKNTIKNSNNEYFEMSNDNQLRDYFKQGHLGATYVWAKVISGEYGKYKKIIQIDSDVIFREECISDIINKFNEGYDLIGPRRPYKSMKKIPSHIKKEEIIKLQDVVSTFFLGVLL